MAKIPRIGVACVVLKDDQILLGKRKNSHGEGLWACPGGHLEWGETLQACAARELFEETGLIATHLREGPFVEVIREDAHYITFLIFIDSFTGSPTLKEPHKCEGWEYFPKKNLPSPLFVPLPFI